MHNVKKDHEPQPMSRVDQLLQILWVTIAATRREEVVDLVPETGIVGVFHDGHELDGIIPKILDPGKHIGCELLVRCHLIFRGRDAHMSFVDT